MGSCTLPPAPLGQRDIRFRGPLFETNSIRILTAVAYAKRMERRSIARRIAAGSEDVDYLPTTNGVVAGEVRNYRTNHSSNASVGAITSQAPPPNSTRPPLPPTTRTTVDFTAPPPSRRQKAKGLIASIFKKKRQKETFASSIEKEQPVEVEPRPTSFGLAHIFSYEELKEATSCFKQQIGDGGFGSVYLGKLNFFDFDYVSTSTSAGIPW